MHLCHRSVAVCVTAYSPLGSGDRPWACPDEPSVLQDPALVAMAKRHQRTPAQLILRYQPKARSECTNRIAARKRWTKSVASWQVERSEGRCVHSKERDALQDPGELAGV